MRKVFGNGPGDWGSIPGRVMQNTQNVVLDDTLLNTQHYQARMKDKVEQSRGQSGALLYNSGVLAIEKGSFGSPSTKVTNFIYIHIYN